LGSPECAPAKLLPRLNLRNVFVVVLGPSDDLQDAPLISWLKPESRGVNPVWPEHLDTAAMFKDVMRTAQIASGRDDDHPILLCSVWLPSADESPYIRARRLGNHGSLGCLLIELNMLRRESPSTAKDMPYMSFWLEADNDMILKDVLPAQILAARGQRENDSSKILPGGMDIDASNGGESPQARHEAISDVPGARDSATPSSFAADEGDNSHGTDKGIDRMPDVAAHSPRGEALSVASPPDISMAASEAGFATPLAISNMPICEANLATPPPNSTIPIRGASTISSSDSSVVVRRADRRSGKRPQQVIEISSSDESDSGEESGGDKPGAAGTGHVIDLSHTEDEELAMVAVSDSLRKDDGDETFAAVCKFFNCNPEQGMQDKLLPGTKLALWPYQQHEIWVTLMRCYVGLRADDGNTYPCCGHINSFDVGLGKTLTTFGLFQTLHLIDIARRLVKEDRASGQRAHNPVGAPQGEACPSGNPVGIQCPCVNGSLSQAVARGMGKVPGPFLYMTTPTVYPRAKEEAFKYFALAEDAADLGPYPRIRLGGCHAKDKQRMRHDELDPIRAVVHNVATIPRSNKQRVVDPLNADSKGEYDLGEYWLDYDADREEGNYVIFASNNSGGLSGLGNNDFASKALVTKQGNVNPISVTVPWAVKWSWVVVDEYPEARSRNTLLMSTLRRILAHAPRSETKILLLSGTALSTSWKSSLEGPARCILPADWDSRQHPMHQFSHSYLMQTLIPRFVRFSRGMDVNKPEEKMETTQAMIDVCNLMMSRYEARDTYNGRVILPLPPFRITMVRCRSAIRNRAAFSVWSTRHEQQWRQEVQQRERAMGAQRAAAAASRTNAFMVTSFASNFPGIANLRDPDAFVRDNLMADKIGDISDADLRQSTPVSSVIDQLTDGCGKIKALEKILYLALEDRSPPYESESTTAYKKNVVVFCARPGSAYILGTHCDKHYSDTWNVTVITAALAPEKRTRAILNTLDAEIPLGAEKKPTLVIAAARAVGIGVNGFQRANYAVIFDLPFEEALVKQAFGRIHRAKQENECHGYVLVSMDTSMEQQIIGRHSERDSTFGAGTGKEATGKEATGKEATGKEATGEEATGKEATGKETSGKEATVMRYGGYWEEADETWVDDAW
jgi:hypothetical protein